MFSRNRLKKKLTSNTDTGSSIEREKVPSSGFALPPSLGSKNIGVFSINIFTAVGGINAVHTPLAFFDEDGRQSVGTSAKGEGRIFVCVSEIARHQGIQS